MLPIMILPLCPETEGTGYPGISATGYIWGAATKLPNPPKPEPKINNILGQTGISPSGIPDNSDGNALMKSGGAKSLPIAAHAYHKNLS